MLKQIAWAILKPVVSAWLTQRALVIPQAQLAGIATKAGVATDVVVLVNQAIIGAVQTQLDTFKP